MKLICQILILMLGVIAARAADKPNILLILADDLGFSDIGCYGGEIQTPNIDALAEGGVRFTSFYNAARCCPSRASLMTGLYPHQAHVGDMVDEYARRVRETLNTPAYSDRLNPHAPTVAEVLQLSDYKTGMAGKWHLGYRTNEWPVARGFDVSFALIEGAMNYYGYGIQHKGAVTNPPMAVNGGVFVPPKEGFFATDAFTDSAVRFIEESAKATKPFFFYLAYNAPHWPLQARPETIARYRGKYLKLGWDRLREERYERMKRAGVIDPRWPLAPRPAGVRPWDKVPPDRKAEWDTEMSVYAAQVEEMDRGVGRVIKTLKDTGCYTNTLVLFLSDNGGAAEDPNRSLPGAVLGTRESYRGYRAAGAHVSSSPFRKTKKFTHEGGISTPLILSWPAGIPQRGTLNPAVSHLIDIMPTCLDVAGAAFPGQWQGTSTVPPQGVSLAPLFKPGGAISRLLPIFWEHEGNRAVRKGDWKLVASDTEPWELYNLREDRTEAKDLSASHPGVARELAEEYERWAQRVGAKSWPASK
jgi:arylsulfatase